MLAVHFFNNSSWTWTPQEHLFSPLDTPWGACGNPHGRGLVFPCCMGLLMYYCGDTLWASRKDFWGIHFVIFMGRHVCCMGFSWHAFGAPMGYGGATGIIINMGFQWYSDGDSLIVAYRDSRWIPIGFPWDTHRGDIGSHKWHLGSPIGLQGFHWGKGSQEGFRWDSHWIPMGCLWKHHGMLVGFPKNWCRLFVARADIACIDVYYS